MVKKSKVYKFNANGREYVLPNQDVKYILNVLRRGTTRWKGRTDCLNRERKRITTGEFKNGNPKKKWVYRCTKCREWFKLNNMEVDHIEEVGGFTGDFNEFIAKLYCPQENLQALCVLCHSKKTSAYNARERFTRKTQY
jgi:Zn finger protein HypA/HybF involved in hydrogenase expression